MLPINKIYEIASQAVKEAGNIMIRERNKGCSYSLKGERNLVTEADLACEAKVIEIIKNVFPDHKILAEETAHDFSNINSFQGPLWVIDPIDGTTNYMKGQSHCAVSVAFAYKGETQCGIVYNPFLQETFHACLGQRAFINQTPIKPNSTTELSMTLVGTGLPYDRTDTRVLEQKLHAVIKNCMDIRRLGAASLDICFVACGRLDAFYENLKPWDVSAAILIAKESGAKVKHIKSEQKYAIPCDLNGQGLVVCAPGIEQKFLPLLGE